MVLSSGENMVTARPQSGPGFLCSVSLTYSIWTLPWERALGLVLGEWFLRFWAAPGASGLRYRSGEGAGWRETWKWLIVGRQLVGRLINAIFFFHSEGQSG